MGFLDSMKAWFQSEAAEARDLGHETKGRLERDLDRREADLALTPEERLEQLQSKIEDSTGFKAIQDRIEHKGALADAAADVAGIDNKVKDAAADVLDLESEEVIPPEQPPPGS